MHFQKTPVLKVKVKRVIGSQRWDQELILFDCQFVMLTLLQHTQCLLFTICRLFISQEKPIRSHLKFAFLCKIYLYFWCCSKSVYSMIMVCKWRWLHMSWCQHPNQPYSCIGPTNVLQMPISFTHHPINDSLYKNKLLKNTHYCSHASALVFNIPSFECTNLE